ncbi:hypothetical protein AVEN_118234-1 [Araneus ventricosus]|uniref:Uncharacterized protein n=1 Tax=Araneus ventricosus TaxID=182803 RepID=A0A4Y2V1E8_ARAVE|nr:hypothetical protein AVEN_118234-1 [Araneus ventricosus]
MLLEKGAVSPPNAWIKKFESIVTQDPMTIRKYLEKKNKFEEIRSNYMNTDFYSFLAQGQSFRVHRLLPSTHEHGESDEEKRQAGANKYRAQKIAFNTHARGGSGLFLTD